MDKQRIYDWLDEIIAHHTALCNLHYLEDDDGTIVANMLNSGYYRHEVHLDNIPAIAEELNIEFLQDYFDRYDLLYKYQYYFDYKNVRFFSIGEKDLKGVNNDAEPSGEVQTPDV